MQDLTPLPSDDGAFQISLPYPRGGDTIALRAGSLKECQRECASSPDDGERLT